MMLYARSCERPSKSSASVFLPSSVSNSYSFSTGTHGSSRRFSVTFCVSSACSASSLASSSRAACHSSRLPTLCGVMVTPLGCLSVLWTSRRRGTHRSQRPLPFHKRDSETGRSAASAAKIDRAAGHRGGARAAGGGCPHLRAVSAATTGYVAAGDRHPACGRAAVDRARACPDTLRRIPRAGRPCGLSQMASGCLAVAGRCEEQARRCVRECPFHAADRELDRSRAVPAHTGADSRDVFAAASEPRPVAARQGRGALSGVTDPISECGDAGGRLADDACNREAATGRAALPPARLGRRPGAQGETPASLAEQSLRTAWIARSLQSRTNRSSGAL